MLHKKIKIFFIIFWQNLSVLIFFSFFFILNVKIKNITINLCNNTFKIGILGRAVHLDKSFRVFFLADKKHRNIYRFSYKCFQLKS